MTRVLSLAALTALLVLSPRFATAQAPSDEAAGEREVRAVVDRLFDAMRTADSAALRATLHPEARLLSAGRRDGSPVLQAEAIDGFVRAVGTPRPETLDERIWDVEIRIDDDLATAWMQYAFYVGERFSHCGVNAFQLHRGELGWKVIQLTDTRRREGCREPGAGG